MSPAEMVASVEPLCSRASRSIPPRQRRDFMQDVRLALLEAVERYDATRGSWLKLASYVVMGTRRDYARRYERERRTFLPALLYYDDDGVRNEVVDDVSDIAVDHRPDPEEIAAAREQFAVTGVTCPVRRLRHLIATASARPGTFISKHGSEALGMLERGLTYGQIARHFGAGIGETSRVCRKLEALS